MSGTVTGKRIRAEIRKRYLMLSDLYDGSFPEGPADEEFWQEIDRADNVLAERLEPRPLGVMEIRHALSAYTVAFRRACDAGRQRAGIQ